MQHWDVQIEGQLFLYNFIANHQRNNILSEEHNGSSAMRREEYPAKKINNARICSSHFAVDKPL